VCLHYIRLAWGSLRNNRRFALPYLQVYDLISAFWTRWGSFQAAYLLFGSTGLSRTHCLHLHLRASVWLEIFHFIRKLALEAGNNHFLLFPFITLLLIHIHLQLVVDTSPLTLNEAIWGGNTVAKVSIVGFNRRDKQLVDAFSLLFQLINPQLISISSHLIWPYKQVLSELILFIFLPRVDLSERDFLRGYMLKGSRVFFLSWSQSLVLEVSCLWLFTVFTASVLSLESLLAGTDELFEFMVHVSLLFLLTLYWFEDQANTLPVHLGSFTLRDSMGRYQRRLVVAIPHLR